MCHDFSRHCVDRRARPPQAERQARGETVADGGAEDRCGIRTAIAAERLRLVEQRR
jgi:hypothetical protein